MHTAEIQAQLVKLAHARFWGRSYRTSTRRTTYSTAWASTAFKPWSCSRSSKNTSMSRSPTTKCKASIPLAASPR